MRYCKNCIYFEKSHKKNRLILTSACVRYMGKTDGCEYLAVMRNFRDTYLLATRDGKKLFKEYYRFAPKIVERIEASERRDEYYGYVYQTLKICVNLIKFGDNGRALNEYITMTVYLIKELNI